MTPILFEFLTSTGIPLALARFEIQLTRSDYDEVTSGVIMPRLVEATTDNVGKATVNLAPCDTLYHVTVFDPLTEVALHYEFYVPVSAVPVRLQDIVVDFPISPKMYDEAALILINNTKITVLSARDVAVTAKDASQASAVAAEISNVAAAATVTTVAASAAAALVSQNAAAGSATAASGSAATATTQANNSATSAVTAGTQAGTATTQAGISTTQAAAALASQNAAAASVTAAALSETNALTSKNAAAVSATAALTSENAAAASLALANKDVANGYVGLTALQINFMNALGTFKSLLSNTNTAIRNYTFPDKDITVAGIVDITKANAGLGNVDNVSGINAVVSTAQAAADTAATNAAKAYADSIVVGLWDDRGIYNASVNTYPAAGGSGASGAIMKGDIWTISVAGVLGGNQTDIGQTLRALTDTPAQVSGNWASGGTIGLDNAIVDNVTTRAPSQNAVFDALVLKQDVVGKDATGGYAGLTDFKLNLKNAANTFTNFLTNATTAARLWVMPDKDGTVAMTSDITGAGTIAMNTVIVATAGQTVFTVPNGYAANLIWVFVNGYKLPPADYTAVNGTTITLITPALVGEEIETLVFSNTALGATSTITRTPFVATDNQTTFNVAYAVGMILVKVRGDVLPESDYTATNGTSVVFAAGLPTGTQGEFIVFSAMNLANAVASTGGTMTGALVVPAGATGSQVPQAQEVVKKSGDTMTGLLGAPGVSFPATQVPSADVNTLDDYEEGSWTPSIGGTATYTTQLGRYTKIGNKVFIEGILTINAIGTGSVTDISNLPFLANASVPLGTINVGYFNASATALVCLTGTIGGTAINLRGMAAASVSMGAVSFFGSGAQLYFTGQYSV